MIQPVVNIEKSVAQVEKSVAQGIGAVKRTLGGGISAVQRNIGVAKRDVAMLVQRRGIDIRDDETPDVASIRRMHEHDHKGMVTLDTHHIRGSNNSMENNSIFKRVLNIDSIFRNHLLYPSSTDFIWTLPYRLTNVVAMRLLACELPMSAYQFNAPNNVFNVTVNNYFDEDVGKMVSSTTQTIVIPPGNYLSGEFVTTLQAIFHNMRGAVSYTHLTLPTNREV